MSEPGGVFRRWSLRQRVVRGSSALLVVLAALFTVVLLSLLAFKDKGDEVINRWQPAVSTSQNLLADLVNQETGVRGYALGRRAAFLDPYQQYQALQGEHENALADEVKGRAQLESALAAVRTAADDWRARIARPLIARVRAGDPTVADAAESDAAKAAFDRIRAASAALTTNLRAVRDDAARARITDVHYVWISAGIAGAVVLLAGFVVWRGLRKAVLEPVEALATQTREVAQGAIDQKIIASGPPEIAALGHDVDTMRARIAAELNRVEQARAILVERGEELARSNADLEQFAYVASHDLSEPLRKVANFCQLLERQYASQLDDKANQYIAFAVDGAKRMQALIADLLAFSRVGRSTDTFEPIDADRVLSRALLTLDDRVLASHAVIVRGTMPVVFGDPTLLTALFQNLVGNALKYRSPDREPRVEISAERRGDEWLFTVSDNGIGIDQQYAERIFTIFQRLHLRDQYGGTGIGLALCRKIVEFHRGKIWLGENEGPGATFLFTIPERPDSRAPVDANEY